ncbi:MAG: hypothetical protein Q4C58_03170 [Eubacteriales bacterium]|nr:hypothetical protein [Eubacteriales bacterium]
MSGRNVKKSNMAMGGPGFAGIILLLGVILTAVVCVWRIASFAAEDATLVIPVAVSESVDTAVLYEQNTALPNVRTEQNSLSAAEAGFAVSDEKQVWSSQTAVEIFRISYENGDNQITVAGDGEKLIAPGTANEYDFRLSNTGNVAVDYTMTMEAYFGRENRTIPVEVRVNDYQGNYLAGSRDEWSPVMELNSVSDTAVLGAGHYNGYTLTWQWPFEGDDAYDTLLGNSAVQEDITLTIVICVLAAASEDPDASGGIPQTGIFGVPGGVRTGDEHGAALWLALLAAAVIVIVICLSARFRGKKR